MIRCVRAALAAASLFCLAPLGVAAQEPAAADSTLQGFIVVEGDTLWLTAPLEVLGSRVPAALPGELRPVGVLSEEDLRRAPGRSIADFLQAEPSVVTGQRQQSGVQSDLSIRGSTFEQVQVLLDGYDVGDPQTGHHLLDLPVTPADIARLEVLPGHGSALYGSGAFGGMVNVVTRRPDDNPSAAINLLGGPRGIWGAQGAVSLRPGTDTGIRLAAGKFQTDGYDVRQPDGSLAWGGNEAESVTASGRLVHATDGGEWDAFAGHAERDFGAEGFYGPFPSHERTRTFLATLKHTRTVSDRLTIEPRVHFRRHTDHFVLFRDDPDFYTNSHLSRRVGAEMRGILDLGRRHALAVSFEGNYEDLDSRGLRSGTWGQALGRHLRRRSSAAVEIDRNGGPLRWQLGGRIDGRQGLSPDFSGTAAAAYDLTGALSVRGSAGSVHRIPTFTELFYESPSQVGNPDLESERGWTWEAGAEWRAAVWSARTGYFERYERDLIEWARPRSPGMLPVILRWQAGNLAEGTVRGAETQLSWWHARGHILAVGWAWLEKSTTLDPALEGLYTRRAPRQVISAQGALVVRQGLELGMAARYLHHADGPDGFRDAFVLDGRLGWRPGGWILELAGSNLLDRRYREIPEIEMAPRTVTAGLGRRFP